MCDWICLRLVISFILIDCANTKCATELSLDISDGEKVGQNFIRKNGIVYDKNNYFELDGKIFGCVCNLKTCIRKCCPIGQEIFNRTCQNSRRKFFDLIQQNTMQTFDTDVYFPISSFLNCSSKKRGILPNDEELLLTQDGHLSSIATLNQLNYCLDYFAEFSYFTALICLSDSNFRALKTIGTCILL